MTDKIKKILLLLIWCNLFYSAVFAQHVKFKHLSINEGLSQNAVFSMIQDHDGFIWIGTEDGLNKYDGYEFTVYKHQTGNKNSLSHSQVNTLLEDRDHNLWVGTSDGLNVLNRKTNRFTRFKTSVSRSGEPGDYISSLLKDEHGDIWIGTYNGLKRYDPSAKKFTRYDPAGLVGASSNLNKIKALYRDHQRMFWVSIGNDLKRFDPVKKHFFALPAILQQNEALRTSNVRVIRQDGSHTYWFGTETAGVFKYDAKSNTCVNYRSDSTKANSLPTNVVRDILLVSNNQVWIGTRNGLSILDPQSGQFENYQYDRFDPSSLSHNSVRSFLRDKNGNIWAGTFAGGINTFNAAAANFANISEQAGKRPGLSHSVVSSILPSTNGSLWVGTEGGGLNYVNRNAGIYKYFSMQKGQLNAKSNIVKSLAQDSSGNLWIGTYDGLAYFEKANGNIKRFSLNKEREDQDKRQEINRILVERDGLWIATYGSGLYYFDKKGSIKGYLSRLNTSNSLSSDYLTDILKDKYRNLWIGSQKGLNYFDVKKNRFVQYMNNPENNRSISNNSVLSLFRDSKQRLWVGTQGGVNYYDTKSRSFFALTESEGLANNVIHAITEDKEGNIWISTNKGLSRIKFKNFNTPFKTADISVLNYTMDDGLQSNQFSPRAVAKNAVGELFFGGINGISAFNPQKLIRNRVKPPIVFTDLLIKDKPLTWDADSTLLDKPLNALTKITLTYDQAFISIKFAALNYNNTNKNQYAYKLEGLRNDKEWHFTTEQRIATYTNLPAGDYTFMVKASNNDGLWNNTPKTLQITVLPPPWKTWWAYTIYTIVILTLLYIFYYYSYRTAELKNELTVEHMLHEKDEELAQRKLSFFTNISHEIKTPLTLILAPLEKLISMNEGNNKVQNQLMLMQRNGDRLIRLINQLLDFRKFESGNMKLHAAEGNIIKFAKEVYTAFEPYAIDRQIKLKFEPVEKQISVWFDRDKLEKILYNLLSNAMKFTPKGGTVSINIGREVQQGKEVVYIEVEDTGTGILPQAQEHLFEQFHSLTDNAINSTGSGIGLAFTKGLVELHHGEITFTSTPAQNGASGHTCFKFWFPLGNAHLSANEVLSDFKDSEQISNYNFERTPAEQNIKDLTGNLENVVPGEKPVMLIVEDNAEVQDFIASNFDNDFIVHTAADGVQGFEKASTLIPDIIISDVMMPNMSGTALCSKLKTDARTSHIPVILLTARTTLLYKIEGLETGADDYITKPFSIRILETRVKNLLELRKKLRERFSKEVHLQPRNIAITSPDEKFLEKVMSFIERNMEESTLSVEEMGKEVGMSRVTLYRKIKALTNQTAIEFIRSVRLKRAAQLLEQNKLNVSEVAYMVGFTDIDYFRKCFKEQFGHTPKEYARLEVRN
jgi:ligand-binding sensor domain-containing protein/signal transduction histidine kinase/DNA-binding response OmpR family regulator